MMTPNFFGGKMSYFNFIRKSVTIFSILVFFLFAGVAAAQINYGIPNKIPDIGTFMKIGYTGNPVFSSTGDILFLSSMTGVDQLYILNDKGWPYQLTVFDDGINAFALSPDGSHTIVNSSAGGSEDYQLFLVDIRSGEVSQVTFESKVRFGTVFWKDDNSGIYYRANLENSRDFMLYFHDLVTNERTKILDMPGANGILDISLDGRYMVTYNARTNIAIDLFLLDLETGEYRQITAPGEEYGYDYASIMPDNKTIYMITNKNKQGIMKVASLDTETGAISFLEPDSKWTVDEIKFSKNRRYAAWLVNEEGYSNIKIRDMEKKLPLPLPPLNGIVMSPYLDNDGRVVFQFNSPTRAPECWLWDWKMPELRKLTYSTQAGIDSRYFADPILIKYKSFDGLEIPAFLYLPPDYNGQPVPFIVDIHGGPEGQNQPTFSRHFTYLMQNGYGIFTPNVRGSSGYGLEYLNMDNYKNRLNSIKDMKAGVDYLIEKGYTKKGMIGIKGASYGGYAVLACITEYPDLFSAAIDQVGIANFVTFLQNTRDYRRSLRESEYGPLEDEEFLKTISPIHKASKIKTPLLVVHGENDPRVPVGEARQIMQAVIDNGGVVDSLIFPDEGHGISKLSNRLEFYRKMVEFFDAHLKK
ncbi:MAG: S9 family peptidase [candidate division Zixibacteria bacterium HGW-Zixibacteria-1]|nr:MAG: S9 family peptidase [candidate division Zixibacteria bacterium HGW-Zixibacteria-1]